MGNNISRPASASRLSRISPRLVAVAAVFAVLIGYPAFALVKNHINGGVVKTESGYEVDLKTMGYFQFNQDNGTVAAVPDRFRNLDGQTVILVGFAYVDNRASGSLSKFQLVYNVNKCCFGVTPQIQERVFAKLPRHSDISIPDQTQMIRCTGTMHVKVVRDDIGVCTSVFTMDVRQIERI